MAIQSEFQDRLRKLSEIRAAGINPYPERFERTHKCAELFDVPKKQIRETDDVIKKLKNTFKIAGRLVLLRSHGRLCFGHLQDFSGKIQICFMENVLGKDRYKFLRKIDVADFLGAEGELFITKHGELTLLVKDFILLSKALRPLPEKWHGLQDIEAKYRARYLDLVMDEESKKRFILRTRVIDSIRRFLNENEFLEVETPVLSHKASGATAKPFSTHHNALDIDVFLRIAPELYLKRCVAGGLERVYEFAKCFRNEGMDPSHLQEFLMLEYYAAYWNYEDNMDFTEELFVKVLKDVFGTLEIECLSRDLKTKKIDFTPPWPRKEFVKLIEKDSGINILKFKNADELRKEIKKKKIQIDDIDKLGYGNLADSLYKKVSRSKLIKPTFIIKHPADTKPLARRDDKDPQVCDTFQLLVNEWELVNAYSEIVDPVDQRQRFDAQAKAKAHGDLEAMEPDEDYLRCMEHGMPPCSGWGLGIDRLTTILTGQSNLKDVVLFPLLRPLEDENPKENSKKK